MHENRNIKMQQEKRFYTVAQVVNLIGKDVISSQTIYRMLWEGAIPQKKFRSKKLIPAYWVDQLLEDYNNDSKEFAKSGKVIKEIYILSDPIN